MVRVRLFAGFRERAGKEELWIPLEGERSLEEVLGKVEEEVRGLGELLKERKAFVAVNHELAAKEARITDGDEIAIFPPVSGG
jgi:molybdopterin synthase sulfur carrier subunit